MASPFGLAAVGLLNSIENPVVPSHIVKTFDIICLKMNASVNTTRQSRDLEGRTSFVSIDYMGFLLGDRATKRGPHFLSDPHLQPYHLQKMRV